MKRYIKSDINSYSYTGAGFGDDRITLANYSGDDGYVELVKDGKICYVTAATFGLASDYDFYCEYPMSDIDTAIRDFNSHVVKLGGSRKVTRNFIDQVLKEYGTSLSDYAPGGYYDSLKKHNR